MSKFLYSRNKSNILTSPLISFTYFFKERALGCLSSRISYISKLQGTCTEVLIFKIFVCSILQLQQTVWTLDLKCSQRPKFKYLWSPLFWMSHACWILCVTFTFMSCNSIFAFMYLVYIWFPYFVIIILS